MIGFNKGVRKMDLKINDLVTNGKISGFISRIDYLSNDIAVIYTLGTKKPFEYEGQIFSPVTGKMLWWINEIT